ncbi:hypothetical protein EDC94DRAFT_76772 [Helicostylum pulchrum]|nr:hypothetical protein EDC94DRAFT_76772 [Helicostylum pulchrum]
MGDIYLQGNDGVHQDYRKSYEFFFKGVRIGLLRRENRLGTMHYKGQGVIKNDEMVIQRFTRAAAYNNPISWRIDRICDIISFFLLFVIITFIYVYI